MRCQKTGKVRHSNRGNAIHALRLINNKALNPYPCNSCGGWHLGTSRNDFNMQARFDQLLKPSPKVELQIRPRV